MSSRIIENLSPEDQARLNEYQQQFMFAYIQFAEIFRRGAAGLELTGEEYATLEMINRMAGMISSGILPSEDAMPKGKAISLTRQLIGSDI